MVFKYLIMITLHFETLKGSQVGTYYLVPVINNSSKAISFKSQCNKKKTNDAIVPLTLLRILHFKLEYKRS